MSNEHDLDGSARRVDLGAGYTLRAPGLRGKVRVRTGRAAGTRGPELATAAFDDALAATGLAEVRMLDLAVRPAPVPPQAAPLRGPEGDDVLELHVPDLGDQVGQLLLSVDEGGVLRWHFPLDDGQSIEPSTQRGAGGTKRFLVPRDVRPAPPAGAGTKRSLIGAVGRKLLKVLVYPVADAVLGPVGKAFAARWEEKNRAPRVRTFRPDDFGSADARALTRDDWQSLAAGRSLLFVHGTFSTTHGAFGTLPADVVETLVGRYHGRAFAFDHPTLSVDPRANADWLDGRVPPGLRIEADVVAHSRGGLVARCLADRADGPISIGRAVFVGVPNAGTLLADPDHMVAMLDRFTTLLNLFPTGPVVETLEAIVTVVKVVGHSGLVGLEGLAAMDPGGPFLADLNARARASGAYHAITADFEPSDPALGALVTQAVADGVADRVFEGAANDLIVPTRGVHTVPGSPDFPITGAALAELPGRLGVSHTAYFSRPETHARLTEWLTG